MDTEKSNLITEQLLQAMDIIASKKIENLPFDKTILCTITTIKDKDEGIYEVSANTDSAQANRSYFQAFAQEGATYEVGDNVYVNVPQNDFSNQKTIISKYISEQTKPVNYINPMEQFIKLEKINYTTLENGGLKANNDRVEYKIFEQIYNINNMPKNYECLGISADFTTLLGSYKPLDGEYGLRFEFGGLKDGWDVAKAADINDYLAFKEVTFSNKEMYGMTYDFFTPSHQEKLINLQDFPYPIKIVRCYFCQNKDFIDINGVIIPGQEYFWDNANDKWKKPVGEVEGRYIEVDPDIQVDNLLCTFGYLMSDAKDGDLRLYTTSTITYAEDKSENQNKKTLKLRWLLNDEDGNLKAIDELEDKVPEDDLTNYSWWENKIIYLYKYTYGKDEVDPYAGPFWERIASYGKYAEAQSVELVELVELEDGSSVYKYKQDNDQLEVFFESDSRNIRIPNSDDIDLDRWGSVDTINQGISDFTKPFGITVNITNDDKNSVFARYKVIILEYDFIEKDAEDDPCTKNLTIDTSDENAYIELSDIITTGIYQINNEIGLKIYESNEITFENEDEVAGKAAMALINGLELECVDGSNGIYRIYGEDNKITAQTNSRSMKLRANFNAINILGLNAGEANITWYYPKTNTMFISPIDKTENTIDVYKPVSATLTVDTEDLNSYYVKVNEQYYQLGVVNIEGINKVGYTRQNQTYELASGQIICLKTSEEVQTAAWKQDIDPNYYILKQTLDVSQYKDEETDSIMPFNNEIVYTIDSFYASNRTNNTIKCKIERYGREYWAEKEFFFGHQGNNGTNYAFDISLEREYTKGTGNKEVVKGAEIVPFLNINNNYYVKVKATLIYGQEEITNLTNVKWKWEVISKNRTDVSTTNHINMYNSNFQLQNSPTGPFIYIKPNINSNDLSNYYAILKAEIERDFVGAVEEITDSTPNSQKHPVVLSTYLPIGISANNNIETYIGGTSILYNDYGSDPVYYEGEHKLIGLDNTYWEFKNSDSSNSDEANKYYPVMYDKNGENYIRPTTMYFNGIDNTGRIVVKQDNKNGNILFIQPIFIAQNAWGNQTINQWDGTLKIDADNNYILSSMIGAGKKDTNNKFSGVLLGQVGKDYNAPTGIYGYKEGVQTYSFRDTGEAFIGASGGGRLEFDGTKATITSGDYVVGNSGMKLNFSTGSIDAYTFNLKAGQESNVINITSDSSKNPLTIGSKFSVAWDGTVTMSQAKIGNWSSTNTYLNLQSGDPETIENLLNALAGSAKEADDATNEEVAAHWEPETLYSQSIKWPDEQFIQKKDTNENKLYWTVDGEGNPSINTDILKTEYPYVKIQSGKETWQLDSSGKRLYYQTNSFSGYTQTERNSYPVVIENEAYTHFVLTNRTYGDSTHEYTLEKEGSIIAKNGIFSGIISAYAGDLGGWVISPGLMSYGYKMKFVQSDDSYFWKGEFFGNNTPNATINADPNKIGGTSTNNTQTTGVADDLTNVVSYVSAGSNKAFIYLRNSGNGIGITKFNGKSLRVDASGNPIIPSENDITVGYLKNIIFSLGKNFAVDRDGNLYASNGNFSGKITATGGTLGGWDIEDGILSYHVTKNDSKRINGIETYMNNNNESVKYTDFSFIIPGGNKIASETIVFEIASSGQKTDWVLNISNKFGVRKDGSTYATALTISQGTQSQKIRNAVYYDMGNSNNDLILILPDSAGGSSSLATITSDFFNDYENIIFYDINRKKYYDIVIDKSNGKYKLGTSQDLSITSKPSIELGTSSSSPGLLKVQNAIINGTISAVDGSIGPWRINNKGLLFDTTSSSGYRAFLYPQGDWSGSISGKSNTNWALGINSSFGVTAEGHLYASGANVNGEITATKGKIGAWTLNEYTKSYTETTSTGETIFHSAEGGELEGKASSSSKSIILSPLTKTFKWNNEDKYVYISVGSKSADGTISGKFAIGSQGELFASDVDLTGKISATGGTLGGWDIEDGILSYNVTKDTSKKINGIASNANNVFSFIIPGGNKINSDTKVFEIASSGQKTDWVLNISNKFGVRKDGSTYISDAHISGTLTASHIEGPLYEPSDSSIKARGLSLNTNEAKKGFWKNALFTWLNTTESEGNKTYLGFLRGFGDTANTGGNVFLGTKKRSGSHSESGTNSAWDNTNNYTAYIQFDGTSSFSGIKFGSNILKSWGTELTDTELSGWVPCRFYNNQLYCQKDTNTDTNTDTWPTSFSTGDDTKNWNGSNLTGSKITNVLWFNDSSDIQTDGTGTCKPGIHPSSSAIAIAKVMTDEVVIGGTSFTDSDIRLKTNLNNQINLNFYDEIIPYSFTWKTNQKDSFGFIAQEIEQLCDKYGLINTDIYYTISPNESTSQYITDDKQYCINYEKFHALHVAKNHQQDARIQSLESEVASLRAEIEQLKRDKGGK